MSLSNFIIQEVHNGMSLRDRVSELKNHLPKGHQDVAHYVEHVMGALDMVEEKHRKLMAAQALSGTKIHGDEERIFYDTIIELKQQMVNTLEKTVQDFEHKGDKTWKTNFGDGVE